MHIVSVIATRNKSCHIKSLHVMLRFNVLCLERGHSHEICYVTDDPHDKADVFTKNLKGKSDKILFLDFGVHIDNESLKQVFEKNQGLVFPAPIDGVDWGMFKEKVLADTSEPIQQAGLIFDTEVAQKVSDGLYKIKSTTPKAWVLDTKAALRSLRQKKGAGISVPSKMGEFFEKMMRNELKIYAYTKAEVTVTYTHECLSNILQAAGVKVT